MNDGRANGLEDYLRQPGLARLWPLVREKYERYGGLSGEVRLTSITDVERQAVSGLVADNLVGKSEVRLKLAKLDQRLRDTKFEAGLVDCLRVLYPRELASRAERLSAEERRWRQFVAWALEKVGDDRPLRDWVAALGQRRGSGYRLFLDCYAMFCETGDCSPWRQAAQALCALPSSAVRLPIFAARVTGDPHGFDRDRLAGKLFYCGLEVLIEDDIDASAVKESAADGSDLFSVSSPSERIRDLYAQVGIVLDDVSSIVWVANWPDICEHPIALPLMTIERLSKSASPLERVFVVENPSVFGHLVESEGAWEPIVCTSGQPSVAALRLLDMATSDGAKLHYSGDYDVKGLQMAVSLSRRYPGQFVPWRLDSSTYKNIDLDSGLPFSEAETAALAAMEVDWDRRLTHEMLKTKRKVFQEHVIHLLREDYIGTHFEALANHHEGFH